MGAYYESVHGYNVQQADFVCSTHFQSGTFAGVVYVYTNLHNDKKYVGQTIAPLSRWESHEAAARRNYRDSNSPFHKALKKYSPDLFIYEVLEFIFADTREEYQTLIDNREKYWIDKLGTLNSSKGYNAAPGGQTKKTDAVRKQSKAVDKYTLWGEFVASFEDQKSAAASVGLRAITRAFTEPRRHHQTGGYLWTRKGEPVLQEDVDFYKKFLMHQYDMDGNYIQTFFKPKSIHRYINKLHNLHLSYGVVSATIRKASLKPQTRSAFGFKWYKEKYDKLPFKVNEGSRKKVCELDIDGNIIRIHRSITECAKNLGAKFHTIKKLSDTQSDRLINGHKLCYLEES